ncbi:peptidoglycan-binding protein [Leptothermofonsia sp. ETS-13]|uniref:peptidoglycan-binding protein n=1 Tax=Leptothermofonsia sp. ETS-13 TaxID=3035696 RepID=UPI003BA02FF3
METLAFIHVAVHYEDPTPDPEVMAFENLSVSPTVLMGIAGTAVAASVLTGAPDQAMAATAPIGPGNSGAEVQAIQEALGIEATGEYDAKTEAAVTDFQIRQDLKMIDGIVGQETAKALGLDEKYRPIGYVSTCSGCGLNIRSGPGLGYYIIGGAPDGAYLYQDYETVVYNDGYTWTPLYDGGWVASDYTYEGYYPVSYNGGYYDCGYYGNCGGYDDYYEDYYPVSYSGCYGGGCYSPTYYHGGCYRPTAYYYYGRCGSCYY